MTGSGGVERLPLRKVSGREGFGFSRSPRYGPLCRFRIVSATSIGESVARISDLGDTVSGPPIGLARDRRF
jgi:hypothetical protein